MTTNDAPMVRVVVLNWNSAWFSRRCLTALAATQYPADRLEVVLVDNASVDGSLERLRAAFPGLRVIGNDQNLGFAEGCNRAMRDLRGVDHVALVNNDAVPEPGWLQPLVDALEADPGAGAAAAMLVLEPAFTKVDLEVQGGSAMLRSVRVDQLEVLDRCLATGLRSVGRPEWPMTLDHHLDAVATLMLPAGAGDRTVEVTASGRGTLSVRTSEDQAELRLDDDASVVRLRAGSDREERVNGLGTDLTDEGEGFDRHYGEPVAAATADGSPVPGFCGGGVLLRAAMLGEVGLFDPRFFAYYEDTDLSWRANRAGWRTVAAPSSVIRHAFGGSAGSQTRGFFFLNYRNWLLTVLRSDDPALRSRARRRARERLTWAVRANVVARLRRARRPDVVLVGEWLKVFAGVAAARLAEGGRQLVGSGTRRPVGAAPTERVRSRLQPTPRHRPPGSRPGGPLVVYVELPSVQRQSVAAELLVGLDASEPRIDAVALVRSETASSGFRRASPSEWAELLGLPEGTGRCVQIETLDLDELDRAAVLLSSSAPRTPSEQPAVISLDELVTRAGPGRDHVSLATRVASELLERFGTP